jgi:hypothetical protein
MAQETAVEAFRQITRLIFKWIFIAAGCLVGLAIIFAAAAYGYNWYTYDRHAENVHFLITTDRKECPDDQYPIHIIIGNSSGRTLERVTFSLSARQPDRSSDLAEYSLYEDDHISPPKQGYGACWSAPKLKEAVGNPRMLQWSIKYKTLYFRD